MVDGDSPWILDMLAMLDMLDTLDMFGNGLLCVCVGLSGFWWSSTCTAGGTLISPSKVSKHCI